MSLSTSTPSSGGSATIDAWRNALASYEKSLPAKDLKQLRLPANPEDVVLCIEDWERKHKRSRHTKYSAAIRACTSRIQRFSASIDQLAQGAPQPGCLLWGSIKFALTIVNDAAEEYEKLCKALLLIVECFPRIELYTRAFTDSGLVQGCLHKYYVSILRFWSRASKFYRRRRLWNFIRIVWSDYEAEFGELEVDLRTSSQQIESAAFAEHIAESKIGRLEQKTVNLKLLKAQDSSRQTEIIIWLAPTAHDADHYTQDLESAKAKHQPHTCEWIFKKAEFKEWADANQGQGSFLWIYAKPGAGKTVLSSYLIDNIQRENSSLRKRNVLYFFCNDNDIDRKTPVAVIKSLLYQLLQSLIDTQDSLLNDLESAKNRSGQSKAGNFTSIWKIFSDHVGSLPSLTIVVDALDECEKSSLLIRNLTELSRRYSIKVLVTSRKEQHIVEELDSLPSFEVTTQDVGSDIEAFIEEKVTRSPRLSSALIREKVISKLSEGHEGMFLWADLMLKELKSCYSVALIQETLNDLPRGLNTMYQRILERLERTLTRASLDLCQKILMWVVSAFRPLSLQEFRDALSVHCQLRSDNIIASDEALLCSDKDITLMCGSLVTTRNGVIQLVHLSTKEFLQMSRRPGIAITSPSFLLVDPHEASLQLTLTLLKYVSICCREPLVRLESDVPSFDIAVCQSEIQERIETYPFTEYAVSYWQPHLTKCDLNAFEEISKTFRETFESICTLSWIEIYLKLDPTSLSRLYISLEALQKWILDVKKLDLGDDNMNALFLKSWSMSLIVLLDDYGIFLTRCPHELYFLDLSQIFCAKILQTMCQSHRRHSRAETHWQVEGYLNPFKATPEAPKACQLRSIRETGIQKLGFFIHDKGREVFFSAVGRPSQASGKALFVQETSTGHSLPPVVDEDFLSCEWIFDAALSRDGRFIGVVHANADGFLHTTIWEIDAQLHFREGAGFCPWARKVITRKSRSDTQTFRGGRVDRRSCIVFGEDGHCYCPSGQIDPITGIVEPVASLEDTSEWNHNFSYSRNGQYLVIELPGKPLLKLSTKEKVAPVHLPWPANSPSEQILVQIVSNSGRFVVISLVSNGNVFLIDTLHFRTIAAPVSPSRETRWQHKLLLSSEETKLFNFCHKPYSRQISLVIWRIPSDPIDVLVQEFSCPNIAVSLTMHYDLSNFYMLPNEVSGLLVSMDGTIEKILWGHQEGKSAEVSPSNKTYFGTASSVSSDAARLGIVSYGEHSAQLQILDIMTTGQSLRLMELALSPPANSIPIISKSNIRFSPDLGLLFIATEMFHIGHDDDHVARMPISIKPPIPWSQNETSFTISPCNRYAMYINTRYEEKADTFWFFCIDLEGRSSHHVDIPILESSVRISIAFHPSLPLMVALYAYKWPCSAEDVHISMFNLNCLNPWTAPTPFITEDLKRELLHNSLAKIAPTIHFSGCSTFAYLSNLKGYDDLFLCEVTKAPTVPTLIQEHTRFMSLDAKNRLCQLYFQYSRSNSYSVFYGRYEKSRHFKHIVKKFVEIKCLYIIPLALKGTKKVYLPGPSETSRIRVLFLPSKAHSRVEIRTLQFTFAELSARLRGLWESQYGIQEVSDQ